MDDHEWFWRNVNRTDDPEECWVWKLGTTDNGYGLVKKSGLPTRRAHRVAWMVHTGELPPDELMVCHHCDNPPCVNPKHLFLGTAMDNHKDMVSKGRRAPGPPKLYREVKQRLTLKQIDGLKRLSAKTGKMQAALLREALDALLARYGI
jgi:hypothetical protein